MAPVLKSSLPSIEILLRLPREELALYVLAYLRGSSSSTHRRNLAASTSTELIEYAGPARALEVARALTEAWMWLGARRVDCARLNPKTHKITPAMAMGLADRPRTVEEIVALLPQ